VLKFVGTVTLGLLTGFSYTLSTLTVPTLLTLPSAETAAKAFYSLASTAKRQLSVLATVSGSSFLLAFFLSPRPYRHPYLLYTSVLVFGSRLVTSEHVTPYLFTAPRATSSSTRVKIRDRKERTPRARMEASYEVVGSPDSHSEGAGSEDMEREEESQAPMNGEEVRGEVEHFLKKQAVQTAVAGLGFLMSVIGIWGDGAVQVFQSETFVIEV